MQYSDETINALARARRSAENLAHMDRLTTDRQLFAISDLLKSFRVLDAAGVFAALDEQSGIAEAERHMQAVREERAAKCTCSARRAGMQATDIHVLGCPAIDVPVQRGAGRMVCAPVGEPLIGNAALEVAARLREQIGAERFDALFPANEAAKSNVCPTCHATHFKDADALQFHIDAAH